MEFFMAENLDPNNKVNPEISYDTTKSNAEELKQPKTEKDVILNENNLKRGKNISNSPEKKDDWNYEDSEW